MSPRLILILLGILFVVLGALIRSTDFNHADSSFPTNILDNSEVSIPKKLLVPSVNINVRVEKGGISNGQWILSKQSAHYFPLSQTFNDRSNIVLYAHNFKELFGNLKNISIGDDIWLTDAYGNTRLYKVYQKEDIKPSEIEKLKTGIPNSLTLFTCDGWYDQTRLVVKAKLTEQS